MPVQGVTGWGGSQRRAPTGGAAYGMPRYSSTGPVVRPKTWPASVVTVRLRDWTAGLPSASEPVAAAGRAPGSESAVPYRAAPRPDPAAASTTPATDRRQIFPVGIPVLLRQISGTASGVIATAHGGLPTSD